MSQQTLGSAVEGQTEQFWSGRTSAPNLGQIFSKSKHFLGQIITVSDGVGQSVTVSLNGVGGLMIKVYYTSPLFCK
jgi:hypothetical protein